MREDICSIPVNDVFLPEGKIPEDGCPFCRMRDMLEDRMATYITGAAMMEPDVRVETNRLGFCHRHLEQMLARGSRLSVALILESLLAETGKDIFPEGKPQPRKAAAAVQDREEHCFVCENIDKNMKHLLSSTVKLWQTDPEFRTLYGKQPYICLPHYGMVMDFAQKLPKKDLAPFYEENVRLTKNYLTGLSGDVTHFCRMYDYRSAGADWGNSKDAIERAILWLTSQKSEVKQKAEEKNR